MKINVKTIYNLQDVLGGRKNQVLEFSGPATVMDALSRLFELYGGLKDAIFDGSGNFSGEVVIFLNGQNVFSMSGLQTELSDDDILLLFPPMAGG